LKDAKGKIVTFVGDVSKREDNESMIDLAVKEFGKLDVLVNNAGVMDDMGPIGELEDERYEHVMRINTYGPMCAMRRAVNVFQQQGSGGNIINVTSVGAFRTCAGAAYMASKAAVVAMTKNTAFMYMPDKIRANCIAPGAIMTEISTSMGMPNMSGFERVKGVIDNAPEPGSGEQIAAAAIFLASDESSYVSGDVLVVDGGWTAG
jgi:NAD(P)-dependent dehydrogenase (short-subunit alcohol dehydrogenase family)